MDGTTLEQAIQDESVRMIAAIREKETAERKRLEEDYASQLEHFQKQTDAATKARLDQEISKVQNRAVLERKKLRLLGLERFIAQMVEDVVTGIRSHPRYKPYVMDNICEILKRISGEAEIRLALQDLAWKDDISAAIRDRVGERNLVFIEDPDIRWGGCLIRDRKQGRIFNHTLERIYFRKSTLIRREVMKRLAGADPGQQASKES
jgi:vacuolar-type H+-ATPase subunit E/Vma4